MNHNTKPKVSDWLKDRHSHTAYDVEFVKESLAPCGISVYWDNGSVRFEYDNKFSYCSAISGKEFKKAATNPKNPKGPTYADFDDDEAKGLWLMGGWQIAAALAHMLTGKSSDKLGRGGAFWQNASFIKEAGY